MYTYTIAEPWICWTYYLSGAVTVTRSHARILQCDGVPRFTALPRQRMHVTTYVTGIRSHCTAEISPRCNMHRISFLLGELPEVCLNLQACHRVQWLEFQHVLKWSSSSLPSSL